jgi:hypothetical protein
MDRRTALATAGAVAVVTLTGATAIAANVGVLADQPEPAGQLQPTDPELTTIIVEPAPEPEPAPQPATRLGGDDHDDWDDGYEDHDDEDDDRYEHDDEDEDEDDEHKYEGRDDDD